MKDKRKKGFTLVEVLLVIAIIALMIAIITPSLRKARQSARSVYCRSLLRQYSSAHYSYFLDTDHLLPIWVQEENPDNMKPWFTMDDFRTYLGLSPLPQEFKQRNPRNIQKYKPGYPKNLICPSATYALNNSENSLYPFDRSYGLNAHIYSDTTDISKTSLRNPSQRICTADGMDWRFNYWDCDKYNTYGETWLGFNTSGEAAFRHSGKTNTVFWDGHCKPVTPEQLKNTLEPWISRRYK